MGVRVLVTDQAEADLSEIVTFIQGNDGIAQARAVLERLDKRIASLAVLPGRGNSVPELIDTEDSGCRELHEPPWRVIYLGDGDAVHVLAVLDSRRNVRDLLAERLLRP